MEQFKNGDLVRLKSGGPTMSVSKGKLDALSGAFADEVFADERIRCQWFAGSKLESGLFEPETLVRVDEEEATKTKEKRK